MEPFLQVVAFGMRRAPFSESEGFGKPSRL